MCFRGPNVVICEFVAGDQQTPRIGVYLLPLTLDHLPDLKEALTCFLGRYHVVIGELSADIGCIRYP